jgi:hypothetical protein
MKASTTYLVNGVPFLAEARRNDRPWGHCIDVDIYEANQRLVASTSFGCHPEFLEFQRFQLMSTAELLEVAVEQLRRDAHKSLQEELPLGLRIFFRLNGPGEGMACEYPRHEAQPIAPADGFAAR